MTQNSPYSKRVADSISAMLAYWDRNQVCRFANAAYLEWFGKRAEDMVDKLTLRELLGPLYEKNRPYIEAALNGEIQVFERDIPTPDGTIRHSLATYTPDVSEGEVRGIVVHVADITNIKKLELELIESKKQAEALATHDYLTGLPNRVLLNDRIDAAIALASRGKRRLAVSIMDLDSFKKINDTYGHLAGDMVLVEIANRSKKALRESDTISRFGGDEFVVLLPEIGTREEIEIIGKRMLDYSRLPIKFGQEEILPSFSMGIAVYPENGGSKDTLLRQADVALYRAKSQGKNQIAFAN